MDSNVLSVGGLMFYLQLSLTFFSQQQSGKVHNRHRTARMTTPHLLSLLIMDSQLGKMQARCRHAEHYAAVTGDSG